MSPYYPIVCFRKITNVLRFRNKNPLLCGGEFRLHFLKIFLEIGVFFISRTIACADKAMASGLPSVRL
jgi:hypothetical protein